MTDYGFAPGFPGHEGKKAKVQLARYREMFTRRDNTKLVPRGKRVTSVREFLAYLNKAGSTTSDGTPIVLPVGDLLLGVHSNEESKLYIPLFRGQKDPTVVETIAQTVTDASKSIVVPDPLVAPTATTHAVHLKGCNLGKAPKFMKKLRAALGTEDPDTGRVQLTAPKHFHGATNGFSGGTIEFMSYEFTLGFPLPTVDDELTFPSRADVVDAFKNGQFKFFDQDDPIEGKKEFPVPVSFWDRPNPWLPDQVTKTTTKTITSHLGETVAGNTTVQVHWQFRVDPERFNWGPFPLGRATDNLTALKTDIRGAPQFQVTDPNNDFPVYERLGFSSIDAFFAGYDWQFTTSGTDLLAVGNRVFYTALIPITDPNTNPDPRKGTLFFNFYPSGRASQITHMAVTDDRFFLRLSDV